MLFRSGSTQLKPFTFASGSLTPDGPPLVLPWANPQGIAVENATMPSRLAISFAGGRVATVQIDGSANMSLVASFLLPSGIGGAPYWCHCPGSLDLIGVGHPNGNLYVLNAAANSLTTWATYSGGTGIQTTPSADGAGNWYFAADDGMVYEVQKPTGTTAMTLAASFGSAGGLFTSSPMLKQCQSDICLYLASTDAGAYLIDLDARSVVITACVGTPT